MTLEDGFSPQDLQNVLGRELVGLLELLARLPVEEHAVEDELREDVSDELPEVQGARELVDPGEKLLFSEIRNHVERL